MTETYIYKTFVSCYLNIPYYWLHRSHDVGMSPPRKYFLGLLIFTFAYARKQSELLVEFWNTLYIGQKQMVSQGTSAEEFMKISIHKKIEKVHSFSVTDLVTANTPAWLSSTIGNLPKDKLESYPSTLCLFYGYMQLLSPALCWSPYGKKTAISTSWRCWQLSWYEEQDVPNTVYKTPV